MACVFMHTVTEISSTLLTTLEPFLLNPDCDLSKNLRCKAKIEVQKKSVNGKQTITFSGDFTEIVRAQKLIVLFLNQLSENINLALGKKTSAPSIKNSVPQQEHEDESLLLRNIQVKVQNKSSASVIISNDNAKYSKIHSAPSRQSEESKVGLTAQVSADRHEINHNNTQETESIFTHFKSNTDNTLILECDNTDDETSAITAHYDHDYCMEKESTIQPVISQVLENTKDSQVLENTKGQTNVKTRIKMEKDQTKNTNNRKISFKSIDSHGSEESNAKDHEDRYSLRKSKPSSWVKSASTYVDGSDIDEDRDENDLIFDDDMDKDYKPSISDESEDLTDEADENDEFEKQKSLSPKTNVNTDLSDMQITEVNGEIVPKTMNEIKPNSTKVFSGEKLVKSLKNKSPVKKKSPKQKLKKTVVDTKIVLDHEDVDLCPLDDDICLDVSEKVVYNVEGKQIGKHFRDEKNPTMGRSTCDFCNYTNFLQYLNSPKQLQVHYKRSHLKRDLKFQCELCSKKFPTQGELNTHKTLHMYKKCKICGIMFNKRRFYIHARRHNPDYNPYRFECDVCQKKFTTKLSMKNHMESSHNSQDRVLFPCTQCDKFLASKYLLVRHVHSVHAEPQEKEARKTHKCLTCDKSFESSCYLRIHLQVHDKVLKYVCDICSKAFRWKTGLQKHLQTHSEESEKKYLCTDCGKSFTQSSALTRHMRIHTKERPFSCDLCGDTFNDSSILRRHRMYKHKQKK